jgi:hypothetical protein
MSYQDDIKAWAIAAGMRAFKTFCQTSVALIGTNAIGVTDVNWVGVASGAALAAIVSLLTSAAGIPEVSDSDSVFTIAGRQ